MTASRTTESKTTEPRSTEVRSTEVMSADAMATSATVPARLLRALCAAYARWLETTSHHVLTASRTSRWGYLGMVATGQVSNEDSLPA